MGKKVTIFVAALLFGTALASADVASAQDCPSGALASSKGNALYLVYSSSDDPSFPSYGDGPTSPLAEFDVSELDNSIGTEAQLRDRVEELTEAAYCEFNVEVKTTTSLPSSPSEPRWQIMGIGTDDSGGGPVGEAQAVDTGDSDGQDYARLWGQALGDFAGGELTGTDSTRERWATAIANLVAHETGHNYGIAHGDAQPVAGEDAAPNHFLTDPSGGATSASVVESLNHFSDTAYELLGHNVGLNVKTLHNWDFTNPNDEAADSLTVTILSEASSLNVAWSYGGSLSPWEAPTVQATGTTQTFQGDTYNVHELEFDSPQSWANGPDGEVPPGETFHVGASFAGSDSVIVYETTLHADGSDLDLHPRMVAYDAGTSDDGTFSASFANPDPGAGFLQLEDVEVFFVPRMIDIDTMFADAEPRGMDGRPVEPFHRAFPLQKRESQRQGEGARLGEASVEFDLYDLTDPRHIDVSYDPRNCPDQEGTHRGTAGAGFGVPSPDYCQDGTALSLFPATYTYVRADVVDPDARQWDRQAGEFVEGPMKSRVFFQVAGTVPDFNDNGIDDLIDIRGEAARDTNENGVPDQAETFGNESDGSERSERPSPAPGPGALGLAIAACALATAAARRP